jgi:predicted ATPase/DNA-binding SARP family transcriptional activator
MEEDGSGKPGQELPELKIALLGGFQVWLGPHRIPEGAWKRRKVQALVKLLALDPGHRMHREQLMDLLWPDSGIEAARNNLRQTLFLARRVIENGTGSSFQVLADQNAWISLLPEGQVRVDVHAFEAAAAAARRSGNLVAYQGALALYTGELLPEDRYEDWAIARRESLRQLHLGLLSSFGRMLVERGEIEQAIMVYRRVIAEDPAAEEGHRALMRLYAASGDRHAAIQQYRQLREALRKELEVDPEPGSQSLYEEILSGLFPGKGGNPGKSIDSELEAPASRFIGRESEIEELTRTISGAPLVTLTGTGGTGKTRLALHVAAILAPGFPDGVWVTELTGVSDPARVPQTVAKRFGIRERPGTPLVEALVASLRRRRLLLVLDNCEHLLEACASIAERILAACPGLRILATSRQELGALKEAVFPVQGLSLFVGYDSPTAASLTAGSDAARLFAVRAMLVQPRFRLTDVNAPSVASICQDVDGLPLAIELAAARSNVLSPLQIASRLADRLRLLGSGSLYRIDRHQTMSSVVEWSYELLGSSEQALFNRLATFSGEWTLDAAESVGSGKGVPWEKVLDLLSNLIEKSFISSEVDDAGNLRFRMPEVLRKFGRERLVETGELEAVQSARLAYFPAPEPEAGLNIVGLREGVWIDRLETEYDNMNR